MEGKHKEQTNTRESRPAVTKPEKPQRSFLKIGENAFL